MNSFFKSYSHWTFRFVAKILGWILVLNLTVLPVLWFLNILNLFTLILIYEAILILIIGALQILSSYIYRKNSIPSRWGGARTGWFDYRKFAKLKPKERQRYRQEGKIIVIIGLTLLAITIIIQFSVSL
ncbi:MAG: hypothetical protein PVF15_02740 [Candidatus Bathyarchaeota archaeon]|jgi:hypothetical protein